MPTVQVNDINIYYEIHGEGEPLVLIMGLGANATGWEIQIPDFSRECKVIVFDNRGSGRSDKPSTPYSMSMFADDTAGLMDALDIAAAHVYGMSMGGMIAQELALRYPHKVTSLILGATTCGGPKVVFNEGDVIQQWTSLATLPEEEAAEKALPFLYSDAFIAREKENLIRKSLRNAHLRAPGDAFQRQFKAVLPFNTYDRLTHICVPTLILTGSDDKLIPAANSRILNQLIPDSILVEFEGIGHGLLVEKAKEHNAIVLDFLRRQRQRANSGGSAT